jgi:transposase
MHATTVGVDLAKNVFQMAVANERYQIVRRVRLNRARFEQFCAQQPPSVFVLESCGSAHHWGRRLMSLGHEVRLLPAQHVRAYVKRNKTDAADAAALIEASRCDDIQQVPIKSVAQQLLLQLHRLREQCKSTRNARINGLRGCLREFGLLVPKGVGRGIATIREVLQIADNGLPDALRPWIAEMLEEIAVLKEREKRLERQIEAFVREDPVVQRWLPIHGIGVLGASALRSSIGDIQRFRSGRHLSSWLGVTAKEFSSGERRHLGSISKRGDKYLRTLLIHGARSALTAARRRAKAGRPLDALQRWALQTEQRRGTNKATVGLANKLARILWATWRYQRPFTGDWVAAR